MTNSQHHFKRAWVQRHDISVLVAANALSAIMKAMMTFFGN